MYAESHRPALVLLAALTMASAQAADEQVFEPGTKHVCVPAANGEGWDCRSTDAAPAVPAESGAKPRELRLRSSSEVPDDSSDTATVADPAPATPPPNLTAPRENSRNVPHYLLAPEARASATTASEPPAATQPTVPTDTAAPRPGAPTASAQEPPAPPPAPATVKATPEPASPPPESVPAASAAPPLAEPQRAAPSPTAEPAAFAPPPAAAPVPVADGTAMLGASEFRRLGDSRYVIELASGRQRDAVESEVAKPAGGNVYLLSLTRDGEAWYVAVWGDFESVDAARSARAEALANGALRVGWPRRVGPLKQELR